MAGSEERPVAERVAANVRRIRQERGLSYVALASKLAENGHPIADTGLLKIEKGSRGVSVDDLVALAAALGVAPNTLLLPSGNVAELNTHHVLTGTVTGRWRDIWTWAAGEAPLGTPPSTTDDPREQCLDEVVFSRVNRPHHWGAPRPPLPDSLEKRRDQLIATTGISASVLEAFRTGASTADIRTVVEGALVGALSSAPIGKIRISVDEGALTIHVEPPDTAPVL